MTIWAIGDLYKGIYYRQVFEFLLSKDKAEQVCGSY